VLCKDEEPRAEGDRVEDRAVDLIVRVQSHNKQRKAGLVTLTTLGQ